MTGYGLWRAVLVVSLAVLCGCGGAGKEEPAPGSGADAGVDGGGSPGEPDAGEPGDADGGVDAGEPGGADGGVDGGTVGAELVCDDGLDDDGDSFVDCLDPECGVAARCAGLLPDPAALAPPQDLSTPTRFEDLVAFLHQGSQPLQSGVVPGALVPRRVAVVRGRVLGTDGSPLSGAVVSVQGQPDWGHTLSRADGRFDLVVNGGGRLAVDFQKQGHLPLRRYAYPRWGDFEVMPDVALTALDARVTEVKLSSLTTAVAARGSTVSDADGSRQASVIFKPGTTARLVLPDGTQQALDTLHVRATEYTVGERGLQAMPGDLPATSGYTYAVELSVDEALARGATRVDFNQPVVLYVDNFLDFPVGGIVPVGYYDRELATWVASANGRVVAVVAVTHGRAEVDTTGDGLAEDATALAALGIDGQELALLAQYPVGKQLWRTPITHFTPWDCNWPYGPPDDAVPPTVPEPQTPHCEPCDLSGPARVQNQSVAQAQPIRGTPFQLHHEGDQAPGRSQRLNIPLTSSTLPASVQRVELEVSIAGRHWRESLVPAPGLRYELRWDGKDAYGQPVWGDTEAKVRIGYAYPATYRSPGEFAQSFGRLGGVPIGRDTRRLEVTLWKESSVPLQTRPAQQRGFGGWTLDIHHAYDLERRTLYRGDGWTQEASTVGEGVEHVAGGEGCLRWEAVEGCVDYGDGLPAAQAYIPDMGSMAIAPDGTVVFSHFFRGVVRKISPDGIVSRVAGNYNFDDDSGMPFVEGGPATSAWLEDVSGVWVDPDGTIFVAARLMGRVLRISTQGIMTTVAGGGPGSSNPDQSGLLATEASFDPQYVKRGPDGLLYISATGYIYRIEPDGILSRVATTETNYRADFEFGPEGSLFFVYQVEKVRRLWPDGRQATIAGNGDFSNPVPDGALATSGGLSAPEVLAVSRQGELLLSEVGANSIRAVGPDGIITRVAGTGEWGQFAVAGNPPTQTIVPSPSAMAFGPQDDLFFSTESGKLFRVRDGSLNRFIASGELLVTSKDDPKVYIFDRAGRHLRTLDAVSGAVLYTFTYGVGGLVQVTDRHQGVTRFERDSQGRLSAMVAPNGQRLRVALDEQGRLASLSDALGVRASFTYDAGGLLRETRDANGSATLFTHDATGRLTHVQDAAGHVRELVPEETEGARKVTLRTAEGATRTYERRRLADGTSQRINRASTGEVGTVTEGVDGVSRLVAADGTVVTTRLQADGRFGMGAPAAQFITTQLPSGLRTDFSLERIPSLSDPTAPMSVATETTRTTLNGKVHKVDWNLASRTRVETTPAGRVTRMFLDELGRVVRVERPRIAPMEYSYDTQGRIIGSAQVDSSGTSHLVGWTYSAGSNEVETKVDPLGRTTRAVRDGRGRLTQQVRPDGSAIAYEYDAVGNLLSLTPPGRPAHRFSYSPAYARVGYTPPPVTGSSGTSTLTRDGDGQPRHLLNLDGTELSYVRDSARRLTRLGPVSLTYEPAHEGPVSLTTDAGQGVRHTFDGSFITGMTWTGPVAGSVSLGLDNNLWLASELVNGGSKVDFHYDPDGLLIQAGALTLRHASDNGQLTGTSLGAVEDSFGYSEFGLVSGYTLKVNGTATYEALFTRDGMGRITRRTETVGGITETLDYRYDMTGALRAVERNGSALVDYTYDANGNRLRRTIGGVATDATYDAQDRLLTLGAEAYSYSADGRLATRQHAGGTEHFVHDALGHLTGVTLADGTRIQYVVDGAGRRLGTWVNDTPVQRLLYRDDLKPVAEVDGAGNTVARYVYAGRIGSPAYVVTGGQTYRIVSDHLGSPRLVIRADTGEVVQRTDYDEWGRITSETLGAGWTPLPFGFAGGLLDRRTGLVHFGAREYDPRTGRWTSKEPLGFKAGDTNLYRYVFGDPLNLVDPTGRDVWLIADPNFGLGSHFEVRVDGHGSFGISAPDGQYHKEPYETENYCVIARLETDHLSTDKAIADYLHEITNERQFQYTLVGMNCRTYARGLFEHIRKLFKLRKGHTGAVIKNLVRCPMGIGGPNLIGF